MPHTPTRTCAATGEKHPQSTLLRFTNVGGVPAPEFPVGNHTAPGRGIYIFPSEVSYATAIKRKVFAHKLKTNQTPLPWVAIAPHLSPVLDIPPA